MRKRRKSREIVLQGLYSKEISGNSYNEIIDSWQMDDDEVLGFARNLLKMVLDHQEEIDEAVIASVKNWKFDRIALIDRLILRLAVCEFLWFEDIPPKVTINEAIDLAKKFSTEESGRFVNGILDSLYHKFQKESKILKQGRGLVQ